MEEKEVLDFRGRNEVITDFICYFCSSSSYNDIDYFCSVQISQQHGSTFLTNSHNS